MSALSVAAIVAIIGSPRAAIAWVRLTRTSQRIDRIVEREAPRWPANADEDDDMCRMIDVLYSPREEGL